LQQLDARTGKLIESFGDKGFGMRKPWAGFNPPPGRVFENLIILGATRGAITPPRQTLRVRP
jgi:hypothetical protein